MLHRNSNSICYFMILIDKNAEYAKLTANCDCISNNGKLMRL